MKNPCENCRKNSSCGGNDCIQYLNWVKVKWNEVVEPFRQLKKQKEKENNNGTRKL